MNLYVAQYGGAAYNGSEYGDTQTTSGGSTAQKTGLINTGTAIGVGGGLALTILVVTLFVVMRRRKK